MKRLLSILLICAMLLGAVPFVGATTPAAPKASIVGNPGKVWHGAVLDLELVPVEGYTVSGVVWTMPNGDMTSGTNLSVVISDEMVGTYSVTFKATNTTGSTNETLSTTIAMNTPAVQSTFAITGATTAEVGQEVQLSYRSNNDSAVTWSHNGNEHATISTTGKFKASVPGAYVVTATAINDPSTTLDDVEATLAITVTDVHYTVTMPNKTISLAEKNAKMVYTIKKGGEAYTGAITSKTFTSSNTAVVAVNATTGELTPYKAGTAVVKLTVVIDGEQYTDSAQVIVTDARIITLEQDGKSFDNDSVELEFDIPSLNNEDVDWTFEVTGLDKLDFVWSKNSKDEYEVEDDESIDVTLKAVDGYGVAKINVEAVWNSGTIAETFYVAIYCERDITVCLKEDIEEFWFDEDEIFSAVTVDGNVWTSTNANGATMEELLDDSTSINIVLWENDPYANANVGQITYAGSILDQYDPEKSNEYTYKTLRDLTFAPVDGGTYVLQYELYQTISGIAYTSGEGTVRIEVPNRCSHAFVQAEFVPDSYLQHTININCRDCGSLRYSGKEACADVNADDICDRCGGSTLCAHNGGTELVYVPNQDHVTHTVSVNCTICQDVIYLVNSKEKCTVDVGVCGRCGGVVGDYVPDFNIAGANMTLGNELKLNFLVKTADLTAGRSYTAQITHGEKVAQVKLEQYNESYFSAVYPIAAKEMSDEIIVVVYDDITDVPVSDVYVRSARDYAVTLLENPNMTDLLKSLVVDMLIYGAEAQKYFDYQTEDLADCVLSASDRLRATDAVEPRNAQKKGENFYGANLSLNDRILLNVFFDGVTSDMYAKVEFASHDGIQKSIRVEADEIVQHSGSIYKISIDDIVLADFRTPITVTVYNADGSVYGSVRDSVESYIARTSGGATNKLNAAIMKFGFAAYKYLHNGEEPQPFYTEIVVIDNDSCVNGAADVIYFEEGAPFKKVEVSDSFALDSEADLLACITYTSDNEACIDQLAHTFDGEITLKNGAVTIGTEDSAVSGYLVNNETQIIARVPDCADGSENDYVYHYFDGINSINDNYKADSFQYVLDNEWGLDGSGRYYAYILVDAVIDEDDFIIDDGDLGTNDLPVVLG